MFSCAFLPATALQELLRPESGWGYELFGLCVCCRTLAYGPRMELKDFLSEFSQALRPREPLGAFFLVSRRETSLSQERMRTVGSPELHFWSLIGRRLKSS